MKPEDIVRLFTEHKWFALVAILIGLVVRLLKSDTKIPLDVPPRLRGPLAIALGAAAGALEKLAQSGSTSWKDALINGLGAAAFAMVMHTLVIDSVRGGKEFVVPGLTKTDTPPGPGKPVSIPAPALHQDCPHCDRARREEQDNIVTATEIDNPDSEPGKKP